MWWKIKWYYTLVFVGWSNLILAQSNHYFFDLDQIAKTESSQFKHTDFQESIFTRNYDVSYYRLALWAKPDTQFISGSVTSFFTPKQPISEIYFELNSLLTVDSVLHKGVLQTFDHTENLIKINRSFNTGQLDSLTIYYHGSPPEGTSFKTEIQNKIPILWTLSEPYGAIDWWPCKQSLTDKADSLDMFITCPIQNKVAGIGLLQSTKINGTNITYHWKSRYPIVPYLVAIAVTEYSEISFETQLPNGKLLVQNYVYRNDSSLVIDQLFTTDTLLRYYDSLIGSYPFIKEKYGHAQFSRGGGMEHQTMSFMTHFRFGLNAHELAHQWFGNKITCGSWRDIWLNEGFATYFAGLPLETMYNGMFWEDWKTTNLERATRNSEQSIYVEDTTSVPRIFNPDLTYAKAGYVLHMLRKQIGDSAFYLGIRNYLKDPQLAYKTALTQDFFNHIELAADTSLSHFVDQWIFGIGYPSFNLEWEQINTTVSATLIQTTSSFHTPFFDLRIPILLIGAKDSLWISIKPKTSEMKLNLDVPFQINRIEIDPDLDLISKANFVINKSKFTDVVIYPNPTSDNITIIPSGDFSTINGYSIYDSKGGLMESRDNLRTRQSFEITLDQYPQGNYHIRLISGNSTRTESFVVTR